MDIRVVQMPSNFAPFKHELPTSLRLSWPDTAYEVELAETFKAFLTCICFHRVEAWLGHNNTSLRVGHEHPPLQHFVRH